METENILPSRQSPTKTWVGSSISDICRGKGLWSFHISPVVVSKYHAVLFQLPVTLREPPKPHFNGVPKHWDDDHVRMPYSEKNLYPVEENGKEVVKPRWNIIKESLSQPIKNSRDLEKAISIYNNKLPKFLALHYLFEEVLEKAETDHFFNHLLPKIIKLALQLPEIVPGNFPLLKKDHNRSISLSQLQIASLLANAFLCTFPWRKDVAISYPGVNFSRLFVAHMRENRQNSVSEKLKCIIVYFRKVTEKSPVGVVTFERKFQPRGSLPRWDASDLNLGNCKVHINSEGTIEDDGLGFLQVDFANKNVGGGVLGYGCVQEEIRFIICPELIISRLFVEQLGDREAVIVTGVERYSNYAGYGDSFSWNGIVNDEIPYDEYGRRRTVISIIDATRFNKPADQYFPSAMLRELNKAYVGFSSREKEYIAPVATGNWGCGAFKGSTYLKALLQLMACTAAGRDLVYYTFGDVELRDQFYNMYLFLANNQITITQLWRFLCGFSQQKIAGEKLYSYIQQSYFDSKKQPKIKKFFGVSFKKKDNISPSTSFSNNSSKKTTNQSTSKEIVEKNKEDPVEGIIDLFDEDIIPATPPEELAKFKKKTPKSKSKLTPEEIAQKMPKTNIIELIDILDGNANNKPVDKVKDDTFLSQIDKLTVKQSSDLSREKPENEEMEVDSIEERTCPDSELKNASSSENKSTKRKISDYFQKSFKSS